MNLNDDVKTLKGIGPKKAQMLYNKNIRTLEDFIYFFPRSYEDRRRVSLVSELREGDKALITAKVIRKNFRGGRYSKSPLSIIAADASGPVDIVFFNGFYINKAIYLNQTYTFYGKVTKNLGRLQLVQPDFVKAGSEMDVRGVFPVYPAIDGFSQNEIRKIQLSLRPLYDQIIEWLPEKIVEDYRLADPSYAVENIHFPKAGQQVLEGKYRLVFDELLTLEAGLMYIRKGDLTQDDGIVISGDGCDSFLDSLPFDLTEGQKKAWTDIRGDLESSKVMNRLIQGDVGSGKTVIAQLAMFAAAKEGYQSAIMAPTEILAKQHYESFSKAFEPFGIKVGLLCSSMKASEKREVLEGLADGSIKVVTGTHALISDSVEFDNLGLVVTDEQHRFGVNQRKTLSSKGRRPNVLVMTATPIPRTLAVVLYGDLDISQIRTKPFGRKEIITRSVSRDERKKAYSLVEDEMRKGRQVYVVTPLIEASDSLQALSAEEVYEKLTSRFREFRVGLVHGAMKQEEKDAVMGDFVEGKIDLLVSTVVIEVGINVPNATVMVVENAERFGLSQLHQLRGRVGRGGEQSYCMLMSDSENEISVKRMEILTSSSDGFEIAEEDLKLRGPGEILGTRQHGLPELQLSDLMKHGNALESARKLARYIIEEDNRLELEKYSGLKKRIKKMFGDDIKLVL